MRWKARIFLFNFSSSCEIIFYMSAQISHGHNFDDWDFQLKRVHLTPEILRNFSTHFCSLREEFDSIVRPRNAVQWTATELVCQLLGVDQLVVMEKLCIIVRKSRSGPKCELIVAAMWKDETCSYKYRKPIATWLQSIAKFQLAMNGLLLFFLACGCSTVNIRGVASAGDECSLTPVIHVLQYPGCVPKPIPSFACIGKCGSYVQVWRNLLEYRLRIDRMKLWRFEWNCW